MKNTRRNSAFSLIEISIVVLIIGILVAGVTQSSRLLNVARLNSARNLTQSAPVSSIRNLALWIDSTSEISFQANASSPTELDENAQISNWNDLNPQTTLKANLTGSGATRPLYERNTLNNLPSVFFNGTYFMSTSNFTNISNAATVFAVIRTPDLVLSNRAILSKRSASTAANVNIEFGLSDTATVGWNYFDKALAYAPSTLPTGSSLAINTSYVASLVYNANSATGCGNTSTGFAFFHNGAASATNTTCGATTGSPTAVTEDLFIGKQGLTTSPTFFAGRIGEIIIFDRALRREERQSIESYLGKKWGITMTVATY